MKKKETKPKEKLKKEKLSKPSSREKKNKRPSKYSPAHASDETKGAQSLYDGNPVSRVTALAAENEAAEENKKKKKSGARFALKIILPVIAAVILIGAVLAISLFTQNQGTVTIKLSKTDGAFPVSTTDDIKSVEVTNSGFYILSGTNLGCFRHNGEQMNEFKLSYSSPRMKASDSFVLIYDSQGNGLSIYSGSSLIRSHKSKDEYQIVCAGIGKNGDYAVVTRPQSASPYASCLTYYDRNGNDLFSWQCKDYIVSLDISDDSSYLVSAAVNTELIDIYTELYTIPIKEFISGNDKNLTNERFNSAFLGSSFFKSSSVVLMLKDQRVTFDVGSYEKTAVAQSYKGDYILSDTDKKGNSAVAVRSNGKQIVYVYNNDNDLLYKKKIGAEIKDIKIDGKKIYILCSDRAYLLTSAEDIKSIAKFEIMQKGLALKGKHIYNYSSNLLFNNL